MLPTVSQAPLEDLADASLDLPGPQSLVKGDHKGDDFHSSKSKMPTLKEKLGRFNLFEFERLRLRGTGKLYEDPHFPANANSIYYSRAAPREVVWKRPHEITPNPKFIAGSRVRFDVDQHDLGDCWYLAALATVATRPALFENVVPSNQSFNSGDHAGIFQFNFWRYGKWERVIVDDRLPYNTRYNRLCFCYNKEQPDEFWSALCEKAYAKLHGSYEALIGGWSQEALVDLTGGIGEEVMLKDLSNLDSLWTRMMASNDADFGPLLTASIYNVDPNAEGETRLPSGLFGGHAYSITGVKEVNFKVENTEKHRLVRVRNPWGNRQEWKGPWSDNSSMWSKVSEETKKTLGLVTEPDGEFWISLDDFVAHFDALKLVNLTPDTLAAVLFNDNRTMILDRDRFEWREKAFTGSWVRGISAGGWERMEMNPRFRVEVVRPPNYGSNNDVPLLVSVTQMNRRLLRTINRNDYNKLAINFKIFKPTTSLVKKSYRFDELEEVDSYSYKQQARSYSYSYMREIAKTFFLPPGIYVVIPSILDRNVEGEFLVRFMMLRPVWWGRFTSAATETNCYSHQRPPPSSPPRSDQAEPMVDETIPSSLQAEPMDEATEPMEPVSKSETELLDILFDKFSGIDRCVDAFELHSILKELCAGVLNYSHGLSRSTCINLLNCFDNKENSRRLSRVELKDCWESIKTYHATFKQLDLNHDGFFDVTELPEAYQKLNLRVSRRVLAVLVKIYGTKNGLMDFECFILSIATMLNTSHKWLKKKDLYFGRITFEQYVLWEINDDIPSIEDDSFVMY